MLFKVFRCLGLAVVKNALGELLEMVPLVKMGGNIVRDFVQSWKQEQVSDAARRHRTARPGAGASR